LRYFFKFLPFESNPNPLSPRVSPEGDLLKKVDADIGKSLDFALLVMGGLLLLGSLLS